MSFVSAIYLLGTEFEDSGLPSKLNQPIVKHEKLKTTFHGIRHSESLPEREIWQFRGIKFANIPGRFRQATLNEKFEKFVDATKYGPRCPAMRVRLEHSLIGLKCPPAENVDVFDEFECLNLNITTPARLASGSKIPVLLYIHGGGGYSGANSDWWCDGGSLVRQSIISGRPVIQVAINYRLTVFGFMGSEELRRENGLANGGNYGLRDMHTAIDWVYNNISAFGGDPDRIMLYGNSTGSCGVHAQIHSLLPAKFWRASMQSELMGSPLSTTPQTIEEKSEVYEKVKETLGVETLKELEAVPWQDLHRTYQFSDPRHGFGEVGMIDGQFYCSFWRDHFAFQGELVLGTTDHEGTVIDMLMRPQPGTNPRPKAKELLDRLLDLPLSRSKVRAVIETYNITASTSTNDLTEIVLWIIEDLTWYKPTADFALHARKHGIRVHEYAFSQLQPFGGPWKGTASHTADLAYLHGSPSIFQETEYPENELRIQHAMQEAWVSVAYGQTPWGKQSVKFFGPDGKTSEVRQDAFLGEYRRGAKMRIWEGWGEEELGAVLLAMLRHLGMLIGRI